VLTIIPQTGYKRELDQKDIWTVNPDRAAEPMARKVKEAFKRRAEQGDKYPLFWALHETFFYEFWLGGFCSLMATILMVVSPFTLRYLISFATEAWVAHHGGGPAPPIGRGIGLAIGVTCMQVCQSMGINHFIYRGMMVGGQSRAVLIALIYEKAMVISGRAKAGGLKETMMPENGESEEKKTTEDESEKGAKKKAKKDKKDDQVPPAKDGLGWSNGRIVNLMSVDTYRVDQASALLHMIWTSPIACIITLVLLLINLTYSALAGFALLVIGLPGLTLAMKSLFVRRKAINKITDQRVSLTQEILQSVRFVKFFGWETAFLKRLGDIRGREIRSIQILLAIRNAINAVSMALPIFASMLSFITYSLSSHGLAPSKVFSSLALFNGLRMPLNLLPLILGQTTDAWQSLHRIQEFLLEEEMEEDVIHRPDGENAIELHNASFTWERTPTQSPENTAKGAGVSATTGGDKPKTDNNTANAKAPQTTEVARPGSSSGETASTLISEEREPFKLHNLDLAVGRNELIAVIGTVGSGKSSMLASLAGDMRKTEGEVVFGASRAFCPQYAWIQNTTLQKNITFGKEMDRDWYKEVIQA
jgi:ATP-binding cassette subfamily C (CFTR/MRP) protein 1